MHPNPSFRKESDDQNIAFVRERAFGTLAVNASNGPLFSHIPLLLSEDAGVVELHLVRSNPILRLLEEPVDAAISVVGGDAYISPDWYEVDDQVPTWNYVAVHLRGTLRRLPQEQLHGVLSRLSASMEERLLAGSGTRVLRIIRPGQPISLDYRSDRLNAELDATGTIRRIYCG